MRRQHVVRRLISAVFLAALALAPGITLAQGNSYVETFDNGATGWKLDGGWSAGNGFLNGREQGSAIYAGPAGWHDAHYKAMIRALNGQADFTFMNTGEQWYAVYLQTGDGTIDAQLYRTALGVEFPPTLGKASIQYGADQLKLNGLTVGVTVQGNAVDVLLNGETVIHYVSEAGQPGGTIGFEILSQSQISIDEVSVEPVTQATEPPTPVKGQDLAITGMSLRGVRQGSVIADLSVDIGNLGDTGSEPTKLIVNDQGNPDIRVEVPVDPLPPGGARTIPVSLEGPDEWANTTREFVAQLDPNNSLGEANVNNNRLISGSLLMNISSGGGPIPPDTTPNNGPQPGVLPWVLGGLVVLGLAVVGGTALVVRGQTQIGDRKKLQKEAQQGKPPDHCTPPGRYVEVENEVELKLMKVSEIELELIDPRSGDAHRKETIKDKLPGDLNAAIRGHWLREPADRLAERQATLAKGLSKAIEKEAYREKDVCNVRVSAHLEGIELTSTFTLYECKKQGADGAWKKVASWEVKKTTERDDILFGLDQLDTGATSMAMRLEVLIGPLLKEYLKRY